MYLFQHNLLNSRFGSNVMLLHIWTVILMYYVTGNKIIVIALLLLLLLYHSEVIKWHFQTWLLQKIAIFLEKKTFNTWRRGNKCMRQWADHHCMVQILACRGNRQQTIVCIQPYSIQPIRTNFTEIWNRISRGNAFKWRLQDICHFVTASLCSDRFKLKFLMLWRGIFHSIVRN